MLRIAACAALIAAALSPAAGAAEPEPDAPELAAWTRTGETETCIRVRDIRDVDVLNRHQVLFNMRGGRAFLSEPKGCAGLRKDSALAYEVTVGQLCTSTIVRIIEPGSAIPVRSACGLGAFQRLAKKPAAAN